MTDQYYKDPLTPLEVVEGTDKDVNNPVVESDPFADRNPVDETQIHETPMGGTVASVGPLNGPPEEEIRMFETPDQEIPMGGTIAAVGPMVETITPEAEEPLFDTIAPEVKEPLVDSLAQETPVLETYSDEYRENKSDPF